MVWRKVLSQGGSTPISKPVTPRKGDRISTVFSSGGWGQYLPEGLYVSSSCPDMYLVKEI
jgi:hypothetical protein